MIATAASVASSTPDRRSGRGIMGASFQIECRPSNALLENDLDDLECLGFARQLALARRRLVDAQDEGDDVGDLLTAECPRLVCRHRNANALEQLGKRHTLP